MLPEERIQKREHDELMVIVKDLHSKASESYDKSDLKELKTWIKKNDD